MSTHRPAVTAHWRAGERVSVGRPARALVRCVPPLAAALFVATTASAQERRPTADDRPPIQDNSFLIEEAYNQERGVVQHINAFAHAVNSSAWGYLFTQEWPLGGQRHQLSYSIPIFRTDPSSGGNVGLGDVMVNYRFQAAATSERSGLAFAPRVTTILPTGASSRGLGSGSLGLQFNLPVSIALRAPLVLHSNAGLTHIPRDRNPLVALKRVTTYNLAQSVVWLAHPRLNFLLEASWSRTTAAGERGQRVEPYTDLLLSPGVRGAIDFDSGLQIVPGLAFPVDVWRSGGERSVFVYLSFEHPFGSSGSSDDGPSESR